MNNVFFREEMHTYLDELYDEFQDYQKDVVKSLDFFDEICKKHGIRYYVGFGSLLGLYRDGEILPWDYDVDVLVPINEKERLVQVLNEELNEEYYFYCPEVDKKCRHYGMRITRKGFDSSAVHMDVFFLIGAPDDEKKRERFRKKVKKVNIIRKIKLVDTKKEAMGVDVFHYAGVFKKIIYGFIPLFLLDFYQKKLCTKYDLSKARYVTTMQAAADTYTTETLQEPANITVCGKDYNAPTDVIGFLNQTYKDYKAYPPIASRFDEFYKSIKRLQYFHKGKPDKAKMDFQINKY